MGSHSEKEAIMSHEEDKFKHSERLHQKDTKISRQVQLAKAYSYHKTDMKDWRYLTQPHRNHKKAIFNCGDPRCYMCMNPRKSNGEKTMQERKFEQSKLHDEL